MPLYYLLFFLLSLLTTLVNKAPHSIAVALLLVFSTVLYVKKWSELKQNILDFKIFYSSLGLLAGVLVVTNLFHFGFTELFFESVKKNRWVFYCFFFMPTLDWSLTQLSLQKTRYTSVLLKLAFFIGITLTLFIFIDSAVKFQSSESILATVFSETKSSSPDMYNSRASWTYSPIHFSRISAFFAVVFLLVFIYAKKNLYKYLSLVSSAFLMISTLLSKTRASYLGLIAAFGLLFLYLILCQTKNRKKLLILISTITITVGGVFLLAPNLQNRFESIYQGGSFSKDYRLETWKANFKLALNHPVLGVGIYNNRLKSHLGPYFNEKELLKKYPNHEKHIYTHPHSFYLDILSTSGFAALLLFLFIIAQLYLMFYKKTLHKNVTAIDQAALFYLSFTAVVIVFEDILYYNWFLIIVSWVFLLRNNKELDGHLTAAQSL